MTEIGTGEGGQGYDVTVSEGSTSANRLYTELRLEEPEQGS